jgi:pyruvate,water dikinase
LRSALADGRLRRFAIANPEHAPYGRAARAALRHAGLWSGIEARLVQGENGLELYVMCEIPSNVISADAFADIFDGFSIGSNDLTQLTLGLDRDSGIVAHLFDERNPAVKKLLSLAIEAARRKGKYIGICGQGPSDHPDLADWLLQQGIESVSLNPDTVIDTWLRLAKLKAGN